MPRSSWSPRERTPLRYGVTGHLAHVAPLQQWSRRSDLQSACVRNRPTACACRPWSVVRFHMPEEIADREKVADAVLDRVKHYTIGFARAGETPAAKGSGVLIKHGGRHGILTCTHVDKYLRD